MKNGKTQASLFELHGIPKFAEALPLALQHVVAMVVGCITPAIIVGNAVGVTPAEMIMLVQAALVTAALATAVQIYPIFGRVGAGIPVVMGVSFAYVPVLLSIGTQYGLPALFGAQVAGGITAILVGLFIKPLRKFFPPIVSGTVVFTIGLSLYPVAIRYMAGGAGNPEFGSLRNWGVALFTMAMVTFFNHFTKGFMKLASILLGLIAGYAVALSLGMVSFQNVNSAGWIALPKPFYFGFEFPPHAVIAMVIMFVVNSIQAIGDISATTVGAMDREPTDRELAGGIMGNGLGSLFGTLIGGMPTATFSQNVGIVTITRVINKFVIAIAAVVILIAGLIPKFSALLTTIPQCVLGGATITVFAAITMTGMKLIVSAKMTSRNTAVVGIAVALGVGVSQVGGALGGPGMPGWVGNIFGSASVMIATIAAVLLNIVIPKDKCDEPLPAETAAEIYEDPCEVEAGLEEMTKEINEISEIISKDE